MHTIPIISFHSSTRFTRYVFASDPRTPDAKNCWYSVGENAETAVSIPGLVVAVRTAWSDGDLVGYMEGIEQEEREIAEQVVTKREKATPKIDAETKFDRWTGDLL